MKLYEAEGGRYSGGQERCIKIPQFSLWKARKWKKISQLATHGGATFDGLPGQSELKQLCILSSAYATNRGAAGSRLKRLV